MDQLPDIGNMTSLMAFSESGDRGTSLLEADIPGDGPQGAWEEALASPWDEMLPPSGHDVWNNADVIPESNSQVLASHIPLGSIIWDSWLPDADLLDPAVRNSISLSPEAGSEALTRASPPDYAPENDTIFLPEASHLLGYAPPNMNLPSKEFTLESECPSVTAAALCLSPALPFHPETEFGFCISDVSEDEMVEPQERAQSPPKASK